jgi:hypothetical protein
VFTIKLYSFFWESFLIKTHKHIFEALRDLIDAIHLFYQNQFPYWSFEKNWSCILIPKIIWCLFKNYIFNILLVEWQVNQATPSLRWLNYKQKKKEKWIITLTPWLLNHVFLNVWIMVCSELVAHDPWNASLQRPNHHTGWGQSLLIIATCAWNEERPSLLFLSRSEISTSLFEPWIIFLSWKNPD